MKMHYSRSSYDNSGIHDHYGANTILEDLEKTRFDLEIAYSGFDNVTDPDLIDCYIYEVNSVLKRYKYLLAQAAKENMLPVESLDQKTPIGSLIGEVLV
ncbi:MAG: YaaL family protein [Lachnospiraceae bacterium]|nr:YaaL family protein [Lachnospiraceae bacterium]